MGIHIIHIKNPILREVFSYIKIIAIAFLLVFILNHFIIANVNVPTGSMKNTIMESDRLIGFRLSYLFSSPERDDIIIFKYPDDESINYVKRVIGLPGDVVQIIHGKVYVNDEELDEPYILEPMQDNPQELTYIVPEDSYFVMGDNRNESWDSRYWTTTNYVEKNKIIAKVLFKYFNDEEKKFTWDTM